MLPLPPLQLSAGGGTSGSSSNAGVSVASTNPFNFDNSGWVVNIGSNGASIDAQGSTGANTTTPTSAAGAAGLLGGMNPMVLAMAAAVYFLLRR